MARPRLPADVLGIFVKAPQVGKVKTRLAAAIGARRAADLYHRMGRQIVAQCLAAEQYRTVVWFAPAAGESAVRAWLETLPVDDFIAQPEGDLETRLAAAFARHFAEGAARIVVIGSDCPGTGLPLVCQAFQALDHDDLVIGPARDGGFYLLGLKAPAPELFGHITWSTDAVFRQTMANADALGLRTAVLPELRDVDTVEDARALDLLPSVWSTSERRAIRTAARQLKS